MANQQWEEPLEQGKPFDIPKREVWEAFKRVKANQGTAGVDGQSIQEFEDKLTGNLYKLWNRLSSGSYLPPPVRRVDIPKTNGGTRPLGIPTVADRIAQEVCSAIPGALAGTEVPCGLLWLSTGVSIPDENSSFCRMKIPPWARCGLQFLTVPGI